ncbi:MAG: hypothetical protein ACI86H_001941 [bacterium]|jgi:hypothetical protein
MNVASLIWGILSILGMILGFIPFLGAFNWLNIPFAGVGLIFSGIAFSTTPREEAKGATTGLVLCGIAIIVGIFRLSLGGGIL